MNDFKCSCPHCGQHIQGNGQWQGRELQCPTCQETLVVPHGQPVRVVASMPTASPMTEPRPPRELPRWARVSWLVALGALTPFIVSVAVVLTAFLGPLALVAGPVLGTWVSVVLTRHCREHAPPRRFWIYLVSVLLVYGLILLSAFMPGGSKPGAPEPSLGGAQAAMFGGIAILLLLGSCVLWLLGAAIASVGSDRQEPSIP
jgi:hypothetical protein